MSTRAGTRRWGPALTNQARCCGHLGTISAAQRQFTPANNRYKGAVTSPLFSYTHTAATSIARREKHPQPVRHKDEALVSLQGLVDSNMSPSPHPLFCQRRYLQGMLSEQQRMIPPLAGKKRNPCSHRSDRARAQGRVATLFPCVVGVAHCVTELAHEDPYTDAATTISARRGIIQLVLRLVICATRCHRRTVRATGVRTQDVARWVHAASNPCIGITQSASGLPHGAFHNAATSVALHRHSSV